MFYSFDASPVTRPSPLVSRSSFDARPLLASTSSPVLDSVVFLSKATGYSFFDSHPPSAVNFLLLTSTTALLYLFRNGHFESKLLCYWYWRLYFAGPAPRSETAGASPVAVVIGIIGDVDIVSMVRFTVGRVEEFIHASLSETEEGFVSSAKKSVMANRRGGSELMWKETEKRIGEDWIVELRLCLVVVRAPFMEK
ncbi:hypothetical protein LWI29_031576 [Acer saccharum]|uniref:Uncharacterized protein n=1 Tax=Acer saccharum TaxID=4024 RepID=A0AA39W343_ACESA|nr:hypothetical protein LWI29_031576 [Acer saccharum]